MTSGSEAGRPPLIFAAVDIAPDRGSEPGRAWNWARALARRYTLHVVTAPAIAECCRREPEAAGWKWWPTRTAQPMALGLEYYRQYARWCDEVPAIVNEIRAKARPIGVHHMTLGSFRVLPRYDRCGLPYTLGPLGGGECAPWSYIRSARLPWRASFEEMSRPWINWACVMRPAVKRVVRGARLVLATTAETEGLLRRAGARRTGAVYPDCAPADALSWAAETDHRVQTLPENVRLMWHGRALWWKNGQIAVELLRRLLAAGVRCELAIYAFGPALDAWRATIARAGVGGQCRIAGFLDRPRLLEELRKTHVLVYPTMHDSAGSTLPEAYAAGVPSLSAGVGGPRMIATRETGFNERTADFEAWLQAAVQCVSRWQREPETWLAASVAARARATEFGPENVVREVDRWLPRERYAR